MSESKKQTISDKLMAMHGRIPTAERLQAVWEGNDYLDPRLIEEAMEMARKSERGRAILRIHPDDTPEKKQTLHLMINAITKRNYVGPHVHEETVKDESFRVLKGEALVVLYDKEGKIEDVVELSDKAGGRKICRVKNNRIHTIIATDDFVMLEGKKQPDEGYKQEEDKSFAPWAPREGAEGTKEYFEKLEAEAREWLNAHKNKYEKQV